MDMPCATTVTPKYLAVWPGLDLSHEEEKLLKKMSFAFA